MSPRSVRPRWLPIGTCAVVLAVASCGSDVEVPGGGSGGASTASGGSGGVAPACGADIPDDGNDCTIDACDGGVPSHVPQPEGSPCEHGSLAGHCSAQGACQTGCDDVVACKTDNPCEMVECDNTMGVCVFLPIGDGTPTPGVMEIPGDCQIRICVGGMDVSVADDSDLPFTSTDCDLEACDNGVPSNAGLPELTPCNTYMGNQPGYCDGSGTCQECAADGDCPGVVDDCQHPACAPATFTCFQSHAPAMTPTTGNPPQIQGDCQMTVCDGNGGTMNVYDAADPQNDGSECTTDTCVAPNQTIHPSAPNGTPCGLGGANTCFGGVCAVCSPMSCPKASCNGTILVKATSCIGGNCVSPNPAVVDCAPYLCSAAANACTTSCASDAQCAAIGFCSGGACMAKLAAGSACTANNECVSGVCDGTGHCT